MALINKEPVDTELFKINDGILSLGVIELIQFCLNRLSGFHQLLDRELFAFACLHIINSTLNVIELALKLFSLTLNAHWDFLKLAMPDNDRIVIAGGNTGTELFPVARLKVLPAGDKDIGTWVQPKILRSPLPHKMIGNNEHRLIA